MDTFVVQLKNPAQCGLGFNDSNIDGPKAQVGVWQSDYMLPINWDGFLGDKMNLSIYSIENKCVLLENVSNTPNENLFLWDISKINKGMYFVRLSDDSSLITLQIIIY